MTALSIILLNAFGLYFLAGLAFTIVFLFKGINKVDPAAEGTGIGFKLLISPGLITFWPLFLSKWIKMNRS